MQIQIKTLGRLEIRSDAHELPGLLDQPVRTALLIHLAVEKETTREGVMSLLWPDYDPERARHTLSQTLYRLRKDLGEDWLEVRGESLRTTDSVAIDVHHFQELLSAGDIPTALEAYHGPFLAGWRFPGTSQFEGWTDGVRVRLARQFREASRDFVSDLRDAGELDGALEAADTWVSADPLDDEAQHCLLELLVEKGDRAEALTRYESYRRLLAADDLTPLDHTLALMESIKSGESSPGPRQAPGPTPAPGPHPGKVDHIAGGRKRRSWLKGVFASASVVVLLSLGAFWFSQRASLAPLLVENRVLVVPLENQTGDADLDPMGRMAADWINQGLSGTGLVEVVPSIEVIPNLPRNPARTSPDPFAQALDLARENRAGIVVYGTYYQRAQGLEFHVQISTVKTRELLEAIGPVGTLPEDPMGAVDILRQRAMIAMAVHLDARMEGLLEKSTLPPSYESYLAYVEGFGLFGRGRPGEAIPFLERAHELSPGFKAPLILAGFAQSSSGNFLAAESLAAVVRVSAETLTLYDRFRLDFLEASLKGDKEASLRATRAAMALQPGGSAHAAAGGQALSLNRPGEALEILSTFNRNGALAGVYSPLWDVLTSAHHQLGEHHEELEEARRGRTAQPYSLATLYFEARALTALGQVDQVVQLLQESVNLPGGDRGWTPPRVMVSLAGELRVHGHEDASSLAMDNALAWYGSRPMEEQRSELHRRGLAQALYVSERWDDARVLFRELAEASPHRIEYLGYLGVLAARLGEPEQAREYAGRIAGFETPYLFGYDTIWRARIAAQLGDIETSLDLLRDGLAEGASFSLNILHTNPDFDPLRDHPAFLEILRPKG